MNTLRRIPRHMVKALAAGAVMVAAALPLAAATTAGAAAPPIVLTAATVTFTPHTGSTVNSFGQGATGAVDITGATGLAADGGNVTLTSTAPGLTFSQVAEPTGGTAGTEITALFASTSATVAGSYPLTVTDDNGTVTKAGAITVTPAPTVTAVNPAGLSDGNGQTSVAVTGTGFVGTPTVTFTSTVNGTTLTSGTATSVTATSLSVLVTPTNSISGAAATAGTYVVTVANADGGNGTSAAIFTINSFGITSVSPSAVPLAITTPSTTPVTVAGAGFETGAQLSDVNTTVASGGTDTASTSLAYSAAPTAIGDFVTDTTTPSGVPSGTYVVSETSTALTLSGNATVVTTDSLNFSPVLFTTLTVAPTSITATAEVSPTGPATQEVAVKVSDPTSPGDGATKTLPNAFAIGVHSLVAATVSASSATTAITPGATASTVTLTGTGFSQYSTVNVYQGTSTNIASDVTISSCAGNTGTSLVCTLTVASGAVAGPDSVVVLNGSAASAALAAGVTVSGPVIISQSPADIAVGAPVGTVVTLTGTGFTNTAVGSITSHGGTLNGVFQYVSATSATFVVTASPDAADVSATTPPTLSITETIAAGVVVSSAPFAIAVKYAPVVNAAITYVTGTTDVGAGATAQTIIINGSGFATGVTVGSFVNSNGVADTGVVATVKSINATGTQITATVAVPAGDVNLSDGYTVTNTDAGTSKVLAFGTGALVIGAGPTVTAVAPTTATNASTATYVLTGTGFTSGSTVTSSSTDATCGATTHTSVTSLSVTCTFTSVAAGVSLIVTNADGGSATFKLTTPVVVVTPVTVGMHTTGVHGSAVVGKTVTVTISGAGFYGQPKITSNEAGTKAVVSHDSGKLLTVRVTVKAGSRTGEHTFTIRLANGKTAKANYSVKK